MIIAWRWLLTQKLRQSQLPRNLQAELEAELQAAARHFSRGSFHAGDVLLQNFQRHVSTAVKPVDARLAAELIAEAQRIRDAVRGS